MSGAQIIPPPARRVVAGVGGVIDTDSFGLPEA